VEEKRLTEQQAVEEKQRKEEEIQNDKTYRYDEEYEYDDDGELEESEDDEEDEDFRPNYYKKKKKPAKRKYNKKVPIKDGIKERKKREGRLPLDDALVSDVAEWSEARKIAFQKIDTNPNSYYYRFNKPGEKQKNGNWTKEERALFMERLKEFDCKNNPKWGIFSMVIPGRVGYQCANFYRALVANGEITDEKYGFDENGRMYVKDGKRKRKSAEGPRSNSEPKRRKRSGYEDELDEQDFNSSDDEESVDVENDDTLLKKSTLRHYQNPLAGFKDSITNEEVVNPYISPYGHVLSYATWQKVLSDPSQGKCPYTKQPLSIGQLTRLTFENIEKYRTLIRNTDELGLTAENIEKYRGMIMNGDLK
jgi:hypothetical protein